MVKLGKISDKVYDYQTSLLIKQGDVKEIEILAEQSICDLRYTTGGKYWHSKQNNITVSPTYLFKWYQICISSGL